ncbi:MAG: exodeoxyribonuclease III [Pseudomonadota bacterium]|nr:exodeoxyribonuclease III [Pseudomonadota bacterium]
MKIATWNINGVKARIDGLTRWLEKSSPDVVCLQEIKSVDEGFPASTFEDMGYNVAVHGQKSFNGVAILSRLPFDEVETGLPGDKSDEQARYLEAVFSVLGGVVRVASIYLPNGNPIDSPKFDYKLAWMKRLQAHIRKRLAFEEPVVFCGDYNVIPGPDDAHYPENWTSDALFQPESRAAFQGLINLGLTDAFRACHPDAHEYSFWDYQAGAWAKNNGIRIDHVLVSPQAADRIVSCEIEKFTRGWEKPSDHVPVVLELQIGA